MVFPAKSGQLAATFQKSKSRGPQAPPAGGDAPGWECQDDRISKYMGQVFLSLTS